MWSWQWLCTAMLIRLRSNSINRASVTPQPTSLKLAVVALARLEGAHTARAARSVSQVTASLSSGSRLPVTPWDLSRKAGGSTGVAFFTFYLATTTHTSGPKTLANFLPTKGGFHDSQLTPRSLAATCAKVETLVATEQHEAPCRREYHPHRPERFSVSVGYVANGTLGFAQEPHVFRLAAVLSTPRRRANVCFMQCASLPSAAAGFFYARRSAVVARRPASPVTVAGSSPAVEPFMLGSNAHDIHLRRSPVSPFTRRGCRKDRVTRYAHYKAAKAVTAKLYLRLARDVTRGTASPSRGAVHLAQGSLSACVTGLSHRCPKGLAGSTPVWVTVAVAQLVEQGIVIPSVRVQLPPVAICVVATARGIPQSPSTALVTPPLTTPVCFAVARRGGHRGTRAF